MLDDKDLKAALREHWDYSGKDEDRAHKIYHDDAILEFPQSRERFEGVKNFIEWRKAYPAEIDFKLRKIRRRDDLVVTEYNISYDGGPWQFCVSIMDSATTRSCTSTSTSWRDGTRRIGVARGALRWDLAITRDQCAGVTNRGRRSPTSTRPSTRAR